MVTVNCDNMWPGIMSLTDRDMCQQRPFQTAVCTHEAAWQILDLVNKLPCTKWIKLCESLLIGDWPWFQSIKTHILVTPERNKRSDLHWGSTPGPGVFRFASGASLPVPYSIASSVTCWCSSRTSALLYPPCRWGKDMKTALYGSTSVSGPVVICLGDESLLCNLMLWECNEFVKILRLEM